MKKYRKKHNQEPGIKVIHHGLRDQQLPDASHVYGVKLSDENVASAIPAVTKMFVEGHETELGKYIKEKDEKNYKRHQLEPLGKSTYAANSGADSKLPAYTSHPDFKFGQKTERSEAGTKELIEIDPEMEVQPTFASMPRAEAMAAQAEVVQKRDYHYDWAALGRDPATTVFGKVPRADPTDASEAECVANALRFPTSNSTSTTPPLNAPKTKPKPEDFVYGVVTQKPQPTNEEEREWGVKQCVHSDIESNPNVLRRDLPENQTDLASIYGAEREKHIPSRLNPNRVTAGNLVNPTRWSEMGVHREQLTEHRDFEAVLALYKKAGFPVATETAAKIKSALTEKSVYGGVCSLHNFETALKALQM